MIKPQGLANSFMDVVYYTQQLILVVYHFTYNDIIIVYLVINRSLNGISSIGWKVCWKT